MAGGGRRVRVTRLDETSSIGGRDTVAVEEPLEVRVDGEVLATTMRTPGDDFDLALGFAILDGGVDPSRVGGMSYCGVDAGEQVVPVAADLSGPYQGGFNVVNVATRDGAGPAVHRHRATAVSTACGICGADVVDDLTTRAGDLREDTTTVRADVLQGLGERARAEQRHFAATGGTHAAAVFTADGDLVVLREDVGRHNAVDKVVGWAATHASLPMAGHVLLTSGRAAFELVAKAAIAGFPVMVAVSAPTSLAVDLAERAGITLVGFARPGSCTVYTHPQRVTAGPTAAN